MRWAAASPTPASSTGRAFPNIADNYKSQPPRDCGASADPQERAARLGRHAGRRAGASHRGRRRDARAAHGAHMRERAGAGASSWRARRRCAPSIIPGSPSHPQHALARELFRGLRRAVLVRARRRASTAFEFLNRLTIVVLSSNLGDNRTLAIPVAHTIFWEMGAGAPRRDGHRRFADPHFGRDRGSGRSDRRFRAGADAAVVGRFVAHGDARGADAKGPVEMAATRPKRL